MFNIIFIILDIHLQLFC